eukprot:COSAG02_NODE_2735_length_8131_cov_5.035359_1_plen_43_part_00
MQDPTGSASLTKLTVYTVQCVARVYTLMIWISQIRDHWREGY